MIGSAWFSSVILQDKSPSLNYPEEVSCLQKPRELKTPPESPRAGAIGVLILLGKALTPKRKAMNVGASVTYKH